MQDMSQISALNTMTGVVVACALHASEQCVLVVTRHVC